MGAGSATKGELQEQSSQGLRTMTATSIGRVAMPYLALTAICGAAILVGIVQMRNEATPAATAAVVSAPAPPAQDQVSHALAAVQAEGNAVAAQPAESPRVAKVEENVPAFDVARIEQTGEAVIAGRAAPGATVELMGNGESLDRAVADQSGQFVMTPSRLPAGNYALTLRSREPDGKQTSSKQSVAVALAETVPASDAIRPSSRVADAAGTTVVSPSALGQAGASSAAAEPAQPASQPAGQQEAALSPPAAPSDGNSLSAVLAPRKSTATVARGDSLWRISRQAYGEGTRYSLVYRANRDRIRNPDRIYPGQVFVLPLKEH
jgi:nucleoid-associated protein YgaU